MAEATALVRRLDPELRDALHRGAERAVAAGHGSVELEHLLLALLDAPSAPFARVLAAAEIPTAPVRGDLEAALARFATAPGRTPLFATTLLAVLGRAWEVASLDLGEDRISQASLLRTLASDPAARRHLTNASKRLAALDARSVADVLGTPSTTAPVGTTPVANELLADLTAEARRGALDPVVGRDAEIRQVVDVLMRRRQNNPILLGDAGVGKTAIVEGLAQRIADGAVPKRLRDIAVLALDVGALQAGAGVRGVFEERLRDVVAAVTSGPRPALLFVDEAHMLIGLGGKEGQGDAANLLKPRLARGELRLVAATTWGEYKRHLEKDPALARRLQPIRVDEPCDARAVDMLRALRPAMEGHHGVRVTDGAVAEAVRLSRRYLTGRQLPDKAVGLLDTAAARAAVAADTPPAELERADARIAMLEREIEAHGRDAARTGAIDQPVEALEEALSDARDLAARLRSRWQEQQATAAAIHDLERRLDARPDDAGETAEELKALRLQLEVLQEDAGRLAEVEVDARSVAEVIAEQMGVPAGQVLADSATAATGLIARLRERIIGQDQALDALCRRIRTYHAQLGEPERPAGVFLLTGPSGVGKTETATALAELFFGGREALVTINLSEYQEAHTVSLLKGAPPGYVGYGKGGVLTEAVRRRPYAVLLLDEVEKAHRDVIELFYQVFDRGRLDDAEGQSVDFSNTLVLMTSNVGAEHIAAGDHVDLEAAIRPELRRHFADAFLGRLVVVPFRALDDGDLARIARQKLQRVQDRFQAAHGVELTYDARVVDRLVRQATFAETGARAIDAQLTHALLPEMAGVVLERLAERRALTACHLRAAADGAITVEARP